jgi:hypothetical protein
VNLHEFRSRTCQNAACWRSETFTDGGVNVQLGAGWKALMIEEHCANQHGCVGHRVGQYNDAIAIHEQDSNITFRVVEAKSSGSLSASLRQLQKGADYLDAAIENNVHAKFRAEIHTLPGPDISVRVGKYITIRSRGCRVTVELMSSH